ncbi:hypothetical protein PC116_g11377 [Phytophthora cactorum]|uniref:Uncharacterized protein n=1 Tax=Phytophthora cactorum TaxID=29920 RepID=A0A329S8M9_9STRA|nr:hypothetical protein Pcac1_g22576 [Phytophthora cactorum]KAG2825498.1 hypothetical protein PC112_g9685 [Phytophthora cactorum]KAG2860477.1 hypothetical protein PC113_g8028 [Phytophthora cactorum]KAG2914766.1 hypothetical protein PC114_g8053 [Phytophthora cactorum]KAG2983744.1 hypothetical protein PC118_g9266 [Phytophthora cactorum]
MVHTRSQIYSMLFTDAGNGFYNCTTFGKQYKKGIGYTNLPNHLRCSHEDYEQEAQEAAHTSECGTLYCVGGHAAALLNTAVRSGGEPGREQAAELFGLVLDGWTSSNRRYVAIVAIVDSATGNTGTAGSSAASEYYEDLECSS